MESGNILSCDGNSQFGYVTIEDDKVVCYTGESNNPTIHKFCNDEFVQAMKLLHLVNNELIQFEKDHGGLESNDISQEEILTRLVKESKK